MNFTTKLRQSQLTFSLHRTAAFFGLSFWDLMWKWKFQCVQSYGMYVVLGNVKPNHIAKVFCLHVSIPWQVGLSGKTKLASNRDTLNYTSLELSDLSSALRAWLRLQHKIRMLVVLKKWQIFVWKKKEQKRETVIHRQSIYIFAVVSPSPSFPSFFCFPLFSLSPLLPLFRLPPFLA